jgi:hypothetical protein
VMRNHAGTGCVERKCRKVERGAYKEMEWGSMMRIEMLDFGTA